MTLLSMVSGLVAIGLSLAAVFAYQLLPLVPRLGIRLLYYVRTIRIAIAGTALSLALEAKRRSRSPRGWLYVGVVLALTPLSGFLHAARILVPLDDPEHLRADDASIDDESMVVGVEVDGHAHAWLDRTLIPHHIVHDSVGGRPVVAAWCAICKSGMVYDGTVDGQELHFDPEGVWRRNMIMRDRETGTLWQHATGEALIGPLGGSQLDVLGGRLMTWEAWKAEHPDTTLTRDTTDEEWTGLLPKDRTTHSLTEMLTDYVIPSVIASPGAKAVDGRLGPLTDVVGVELDGQARAYPVEILEDRGDVTEKVDGSLVRVSFDSARNRAEVLVDEQPVDVKRTRWLEWSEFHPETSVYEPDPSYS
jgi:hypothetical protein